MTAGSAKTSHMPLSVALITSCVKSSITQTTLYMNRIRLTNGTYDETSIAKTVETLPDYEERMKVNNVTINKRVIANFSRVHGSDYEDDFLVTFTDGGTLVRNAVRGFFPGTIRSTLPKELSMNVTEATATDDPGVVVNSDMESSIPGIFVVGDTNSDKSHNVPHAMWSAKRAVVFLHGDLAVEYTDTLIEEDSASKHSKRAIDAKRSLEGMKRSLDQRIPKYDASARDSLVYMEQ